jgi:hypothetical protein
MVGHCESQRDSAVDRRRRLHLLNMQGVWLALIAAFRARCENVKDSNYRR